MYQLDNGMAIILTNKIVVVTHMLSYLEAGLVAL